MRIIETKLRTALALAVAACLAAAPASAFASSPGKKCELDTQTCLDQMVRYYKDKGWLGIEYENAPGPDFMRLTRVVPGSPADSAGFLAGDVLIAINGVKFSDNTEEECVTCAVMKKVWKPGSKVDYVVLRDGKELRLTATLATLPPDVMAMMIGMHMLEHANP